MKKKDTFSSEFKLPDGTSIIAGMVKGEFSIITPFREDIIDDAIMNKATPEQQADILVALKKLGGKLSRASLMTDQTTLADDSATVKTSDEVGADSEVTTLTTSPKE
jgi:hypothetical protein